MNLLAIIALPALSILLFIIYLVLIAVLRWLLAKDKKMSSAERKISTMVILGSGGHTSEMIRMISVLNSTRYYPKTFVLAQTDKFSLNKLKEIGCDSEILVIPRSREIHQSWISTVFTTLWAFISCFQIIWKHRPELLLCNGPGTCVPPCFVAWLYNKLMVKKTKIVFVESICRINTVSLTGKILRYFADICLAQWPELADQDERFKYIARFT